MAVNKKDEALTVWESVPWQADEAVAAQQERGFSKRAAMAILWLCVPYGKFPQAGIFGKPKTWFSSVGAAYYASVCGEEFVLIENIWSGWPDPPRWGLISRPMGEEHWRHWGHFPELPQLWNVSPTRS